jgi:hypothetical protein
VVTEYGEGKTRPDLEIRFGTPFDSRYPDRPRVDVCMGRVLHAPCDESLFDGVRVASRIVYGSSAVCSICLDNRAHLLLMIHCVVDHNSANLYCCSVLHSGHSNNSFKSHIPKLTTFEDHINESQCPVLTSEEFVREARMFLLT